MHTLIVVALGFALFALCTAAGFAFAGVAGVRTFALWFLPLWFVGAGINMYLGVARAGYSVADEAPIFLLVFAIPALVALLVWWKLR